MRATLCTATSELLFLIKLCQSVIYPLLVQIKKTFLNTSIIAYFPGTVRKITLNVFVFKLLNGILQTHIAFFKSCCVNCNDLFFIIP